jgi:N-acetylmuramoyl-L-alanine amidase
MSQKPPPLLQHEFAAVDEALSAQIARATATLVQATMAHRTDPSAGIRITLEGGLGAGKTTWVRSFLQALGITGRIKSPSFSVVESYEADGLQMHHFDFYRQADPAAWQGGGLRDLLSEPAIHLIEWPQRAHGLTPAHIQIHINWADNIDAQAPRCLRISINDCADTINFRPHLQAWRDALLPKSGERRQLMLSLGVVLLLGVRSAPSSAAKMLAVRIWPAKDYTRITIEHDTEGLVYKTQRLENPLRFVLDIEGALLNDALRELIARVTTNDPYIKTVRVGQYQPRVIRIVFELKQDIQPQVFSLPAIAQYQNRLVLDLYPATEQDPLMSFLATYEKERAISPSVTRAPDMTDPSAPREIRQAVVNRLVTIALDAGHGGEDPGAIGKRGTYEKDIVLSIARRLKKLIDQEPNMRAYLTRDGDYFVPLHTRVQKARRVQADLFVSIHADAWVSPTARGSSVYALSEKGASSSAARWMANKENSADLIGGLNIRHKDRTVAETLLDMSTTAQIKDSLKLGQSVLKEIGGINALHKAKVEQAGFAVLRAPEIPSILVETAFISNPDEELRLKDEAYQDQMAVALTAGIRRYFLANPPLSKSKMM